MSLTDPYGRPYKVGQTITLPPTPPQQLIDAKVVEVSALAAPSKQNPKILVRRLVAVATFNFEVPLNAPGMLPFPVTLQPEESKAAEHAEEKPKPVLVEQ